MLVKCQVCSERSEKESMYCEDTGKHRKYYHHSCWPLELERREKVSKEKEGWEKLLNYIRQIYGFKIVPPSFMPFLQDLRNGTERFGGPVVKQRKNGVEYEIIIEAYRLSLDRILNARRTISFENDYRELKYGISIVKGNINNAYMNLTKQKESQERLSVAKPVESVQVEYKKKKDDKDISAWVDEE